VAFCSLDRFGMVLVWNDNGSLREPLQFAHRGRAHLAKHNLLMRHFPFLAKLRGNFRAAAFSRASDMNPSVTDDADAISEATEDCSLKVHCGLPLSQSSSIASHYSDSSRSEELLVGAGWSSGSEEFF